MGSRSEQCEKATRRKQVVQMRLYVHVGHHHLCRRAHGKTDWDRSNAVTVRWLYFAKKMFRKVPNLRLRIAGKSIPVEKFCERKAQRFLRIGKLYFSHYVQFLWENPMLLGVYLLLVWVQCLQLDFYREHLTWYRTKMACRPQRYFYLQNQNDVWNFRRHKRWVFVHVPKRSVFEIFAKKWRSWNLFHENLRIVRFPKSK